jgi:hypothetical protein
VVKRLAAGDDLIELNVSSEARRQDPTLPATWPMRAIRYRRRGFKPQLLLTSLLDAKGYPAAEIVALYHERWELELAYNEVKRTMLRREESLRSKSYAQQERAWGRTRAVGARPRRQSSAARSRPRRRRGWRPADEDQRRGRAHVHRNRAANLGASTAQLDGPSA